MLKNIYIEHEPIYINTPYGKIYIESIKSSKELAVTVFDVDSKVKLWLAVSDKDYHSVEDDDEREGEQEW